MLTDKYRPKNFEDIQGQAAVDIVNSYIDADSLPGLWIFYGPRGVGKTSTARVLAKALNCLDRGESKEPCLQCMNCQEIAKGFSSLIMEVDGASNRGIDEIRNLKKIASLRVRGTKVIIIDESHQLTEAAFNALLKVTEEPPKHVTFILVTTKMGKIIETIRDRAVLVEFTRVKETILVNYLKNIAKKEEIENKLSSDDIEAIVGNSDGSVRSIMKGLDTFKQFVKGGKEEGFADIYSVTDHTELEISVVKSFLGKKIGGFIKSIGILSEEGYSPVQILIVIYSGVLNVLLREKGFTKLKGTEGLAGVSYNMEQVKWFIKRFPTWLSVLREFPDSSLLTKMLLESICLSEDALD